MKRSVVVFVCLAVSCGRVRDHYDSAPEAGASTGGARSVSSTGGRSAAGGAPSNGGAITVQDAGRTSIPDASVPLADSGLDSGPPVVDQDAAAALHVVSVHAGMRHSCAVLDSGQVACWGANATGQLGDGTTTERDTPFVVPGITDAVDVQAGGMHSCALRATGGVLCWGAAGMIGDGTAVSRGGPTPVKGIAHARQIACGFSSSCAVDDAGKVLCWGANLAGMLGDGTTEARLEPVAPLGLGKVAEVRAGVGHTCARLESGTVTCWGSNILGEQGGEPAQSITTPRLVVGLSNVRALSLGAFHTCVVGQARDVRCIGSNIWGELGNGSRAASPDPSAVVLHDIVGLSAGSTFTVALSDTGRVSYWGAVMEADGATPHLIAYSPAHLGQFDGAAQVSAGFAHACARFPSGALACWGDNTFGQLGDGTRDNHGYRAVFVQAIAP